MLIWLASYPRSGNTFLRVILNRIFGLKTYSIYNDPVDIAADQQTADLVGHQALENVLDLSFVRASDQLYLVKTHSPPENSEDPAIYLIRDGRESSLSYANYQMDYGDRKDIHITLEEIIRGEDQFGSWGEHLKSWLPKERPNTLLIKFEELITAPESFIEPIAKFLNVVPIQSEIPSFDELKAVNKKFFRRGEVSSWKAELLGDLHTLFWLRNHREMHDYGYSNDSPVGYHNPSKQVLMRMLVDRNNRLLQTFSSYQDAIEHKDDSDMGVDFGELAEFAISWASNQQDDLADIIDYYNKILQAPNLELSDLKSELDLATSTIAELREEAFSTAEVVIEEKLGLVRDMVNSLNEQKDKTHNLELQLEEHKQLLGESNTQKSELKEELSLVKLELETTSSKYQQQVIELTNSNANHIVSEKALHTKYSNVGLELKNVREELSIVESSYAELVKKLSALQIEASINEETLRELSGLKTRLTSLRAASSPQQKYRAYQMLLIRLSQLENS